MVDEKTSTECVFLSCPQLCLYTQTVFNKWLQLLIGCYHAARVFMFSRKLWLRNQVIKLGVGPETSNSLIHEICSFWKNWCWGTYLLESVIYSLLGKLYNHKERSFFNMFWLWFVLNVYGNVNMAFWNTFFLLLSSDIVTQEMTPSYPCRTDGMCLLCSMYS